MDLETADLVKASANAFLATKLSFINSVAEVCEAVGADIVHLAEALAYDERIGGHFLTPGLGLGGSHWQVTASACSALRSSRAATTSGILPVWMSAAGA